MKVSTTCPPHYKNEPKAVIHPQAKFRDQCYPQRLRIIMNYHKFNQVVIPTAAATPDVLSLMKPINEASVIIYNQKNGKYFYFYTNLKYYQKYYPKISALPGMPDIISHSLSIWLCFFAIE